SAAGALPLIDEKSRKEADLAFDQILTQMENRRIALVGLIEQKRALFQAKFAQKQALIQAKFAQNQPLARAQLAREQQAALMAALADPTLQAHYSELVGSFIIAMSTLPPRNCDKLNHFQENARENLYNLGPDGIRAMVDGVN